MKKFATLFFFLFFCCIHFLAAQTPVVEWQKPLGGNNGDYAWSIEPTTDGGYITAGYTEGKDNGDVMGYHGNVIIGDIWIVKTDNIGNIQWQKCLGGAYMETGGYIHQTPDGGYIVAGSAASVDCNITGNHGGLDYWVVKLNNKGDIVWQKMLGGSDQDYAYSIALTADGGYMVAGETASSDGDVTLNHGGRDFWVIKLDGNGNLIWQKSLGGSLDEEACNVQVTADGGCVATGYTLSNDGDVSGNHGNRDYWVVKLDNTGNLQWQKCLGGTLSEVAWSVKATIDGGYIVAGAAGSGDGDVSGNHFTYGPGPTDFWVVKLNSSGNIQWQKCYGGNDNDIAYDIQLTADGGYVVAGSAESPDGDLNCNAGSKDMWIIKINSSGTLQWQKNIGGNYYDEAYNIRPLSDGSFIIAGTTCSQDISGFHPESNQGSCGDFWIVKLSAPVPTTLNPIVTIDPASANICQGATATLTASALYAGISPSYQWKKNGVVAGTNSPAYTASGFTNGDMITCTVSSGGGCNGSTMQATDAVTIKVNNATISPQINIAADNTFICNCTTITVKASVLNAGSSPVYKWAVNGANAGSNGNIFISSSLKNGDVINCTYTDNSSCVAGGSVVSNSIKIGVGNNQAPSVSITGSVANAICAGSAATFTATPVNAGTNPSFQWQVNGINAGTNSNSFTSASLQNGDKISCTIKTDPLFACAISGSASSNNIVVSIVSQANPSVIIATLSGSICAGVAVTFTATPTNAGANPTYHWKINGADAGTNNSSFTTASLINGDIVSCNVDIDPLFTCAVTSTATSNTIAVTVNNSVAPSITIIASDNDVCIGKAITFTALVQNAGTSPSYQWKINNTNAGSTLSTYTSDSLQNGDLLYCLLTPDNTACSATPVSSNSIAMIINDTPAVTVQPLDTIIKTGSKIQLHAEINDPQATFTWSPDYKLQNPSSLSPTTLALTDNTHFSLTALSSKGCIAKGEAFIRIFTPLYMPSAFTPNNDGVNDVFRIPPGSTLLLTEFSVYDRWGKRVFTTRDTSKGWDGRYNGTEADPGTYVYVVSGMNDKGKVLAKGTVILIR